MNKGNAKDYLEVQLLLACLQHFIYLNNLEAIQTLAKDEKLNWEKLVNLSVKQSVQLPVFHVLMFNQIKNIPPKILNQINKTQKFFINRNRNLVTELIRVERTFKKHGLTIIPYKGFAFASQFYKNIIQRFSVDLDFALDLNEFKKVKPIMESLGYEELKGGLGEDNIERSRAYFLDYPFVLKKDGKKVSNVEFHWTPSHHILNIPITFSNFFDRKESIRIGDFKSSTFNKVDQSLFAIIHHGNVDCWGKLKHLVDFAIILKELNHQEIEALEMQCKKYKIYNSYQVGKYLLNDFFNQKFTYKKSPSKRWVNEIIQGDLKGNWSDNKRKFLYFISCRDNFMDKIIAAFKIFRYQFFIKPKLGDE